MSSKKERQKIYNKIKKQYEKGGDLLGQGAYGCLFDTDMYCYQNEYANMITKNVKRYTKVFDTITETDIEWKNSKIIAQLDPGYTNFVYANERCRITYDELKKDKDFLKCNLPLYENKDNLGALKMIDGGIDYEKYLQKNPSFESFINSIITLFEGLVKLEDNNLIHQDIKSGNVLYDEINNKWRYIDYGLLKYKNEIYDKTNLMLLESTVPSVFPLPPEYRIYYNRNRDIFTIENNIYNFNLSSKDIKTYNDIKDIYLSRDEYYKKLDDFIKYIKKFKEIDLTKEMIKYTNKIDIYSLGLLLAYLTLYLRHDNYEKNKLVYDQYKLLIKLMITPDPRERIAPKQALEFIKNILKNIPK